jgi:type I restriction enzyme S subunit
LDQLKSELAVQLRLLEERFRTLLVERFIAKDRSETAGMVRLKHLFEFDRGGIWGDEPTGGPDDVTCIRVADFDRYTFRVGSDSETRRSVPEAQALPRLLRRGDVLLEKSGGTQDKPVGCAVSYEGDERAVCSNFVAQLRPRSEHNARFIGLLMAAHYQAKLNTPYVKQTTGIQNLDGAGYLGDYAFVPDRATQDAVVAEVEQELDLAVRASSELDRSAALLNERKTAIITAAVTGQMEVA